MDIMSPVDAAQVDDRVSGLNGNWGRGVVGLGLAALLAYGGFRYFDQATPANAGMPPADVTVAPPLMKRVVEWDDYIGRFAPSQTVELRPRVSGQITALHFKDGDMVRKGQVLFTIDQRPFQAAADEARADAASAASALALAQSDLRRATRLKGDDAVSGGEIDQIRARVQSTQAGLAAAQARLAQRMLDLEFTEVKAPIAGRVSDRRVDIGNLVTGGNSGSATVLTTINALDPIYFTFDASEALYLKAQRARQAGAPAATVQIRLQDEASYRWTGRIDFTDKGLDPRSGTIRGRAVLVNPNGFLMPGLFGDMRLADTAPATAMLVPDRAVQTDQDRKSLLVVADNNSVSAKPVTLGALVDGLRVIRSGLAPNDHVIIDGMQGAMPGGKVAPRAGRITPDTDIDAGMASAPVAAQATFAP
jgi:multidrug efflux system membrane fusion protein